MRKYNRLQTSIIPQTTKDEFVIRTRQQALNIGFARWLIAMLIAGSLFAVGFAVKPDIAIKCIVPLLALTLAYAINKYSEALEYFTDRDREMLESQYIKSDTQLIIPKEETQTNEDITVIPQAKGNGHYNLHIGLTETQLQHIAQTLLDTKTLTVNYIESLGLSRANAERLRAELSQFDIVYFDDKNRVHLTDDGKRICKRILK